jgi:hypothetical protein
MTIRVVVALAAVAPRVRPDRLVPVELGFQIGIRLKLSADC